MTCALDAVQTKRLRGTRVTERDLPYLLETDSDIRVQRTLFGQVQTPEQSARRLRRWIAGWDDARFGFWIFSKGEGEDIVGHGGLFRSPRVEGEVEVGYVIKPAFWGRGFATEIALVSLHVGFDRLHLPRIIGIAQASNAASRRIFAKCGMQLEEETPSPDGVLGVRYAISALQWSSLKKRRPR